MEDIRIDVEEPNQDALTIPLEKAVKMYDLNEDDIAALKGGQVVWYKDVALSLHGLQGDTDD